MLEVREELCTHCGLCTRVCPVGAIGLRFGIPQIDLERCVGCQACSSVCPSHAIQPIWVSDLEELKRRLSNLSQRILWVSGKLDRLTPKYQRQR